MRIPRHLLLFVFLALLAVTGCSREGKVKRSSIIADRKLVAFLRDIHLTNAYMTSAPLSGDFLYLDSIQLYQPLFEKHHISQRKFEITMRYYAEYPEELEEIYDMVIRELTELEAAVAALPPKPAESDTMNLWPQKMKWSFPEEAAHSSLDFDIELKGTGTYTITVKIILFTDDESINPGLTAYFWGDDGSDHGYRDLFAENRYSRTGVMTTHTVSKVLSAPGYSRLRGKILDYDNLQGDWKQHAKIEGIWITRSPVEETMVPE